MVDHTTAALLRKQIELSEGHAANLKTKLAAVIFNLFRVEHGLNPTLGEFEDLIFPPAKLKPGEQHMIDLKKTAHLRRQIESSERRTSSLKAQLAEAERENVKPSDQIVTDPPKFTAQPVDHNDPDIGL